MAAVRFSATPSITNVFLKLVTCLFIFYSSFFSASSLCLGAFRMEKFDGLMPFDFNEPPSLKASYIAIIVATEATFLLSGLLFALVVRGWLWDYAVSVTTIHIITSCVVMLSFPLGWHWWAAIGCGLLLMVTSGQLVALMVCRELPTIPIIEDRV